MFVQLEPNGTRKLGGSQYPFNLVFGPEAQNCQIFQSVIEPLVSSAMDGFNVNVLAYGQEDYEKTQTMMGTPEQPGIVYLAITHIFTLIKNSPERSFHLRFSFLETCFKDAFDLLSSRKKLAVEEQDGQWHVQHLTETNATTAYAVWELIKQCTLVSDCQSSYCFGMDNQIHSLKILNPNR